MTTGLRCEATLPHVKLRSPSVLPYWNIHVLSLNETVSPRIFRSLTGGNVD